MFLPDPAYYLPIFGADTIQNSGVTAIVDISFVDGVDWSDKLHLSVNKYNLKIIVNYPNGVRYSHLTVLARLKTEEEQDKFYQVALEYLRIYCTEVQTAQWSEIGLVS